jgi:ribosomal protein L23
MASRTAPVKKSVLTSLRQTEKAMIAQTRMNVYVFNVVETATKKSVAACLKDQYKVTPLKIRMARTPRKLVFIRGKKGTKSGIKKAYVYLKKGDTIAA